MKPRVGAGLVCGVEESQCPSITSALTLSSPVLRGLCGAGAVGQSPPNALPPRLSTAPALTMSSRTWDLAHGLPWGCCASSPHHRSTLNLSSFPGDDPNKVINPFVTGVFGALAGAASVFGNTPLDVVKTRMQVRHWGTVRHRSACGGLVSPALWELCCAAPGAGAQCWRGMGGAWGCCPLAARQWGCRKVFSRRWGCSLWAWWPVVVKVDWFLPAQPPALCLPHEIPAGCIPGSGL